MEQLGLRGRVSLLDGGLEAWKADGLPLSQETPMVSPGTLRSTSHQTAVVDAEWIVQHQKDSGVKIVDARTPQFYQGSGGGMPRAGHIPGALNIPFSSVVDSTNKLKDDSTLTAMFTSTGIRTGDTIVSYCHIGQQATVLYLVARHLGHEARLYDGSFEDWSGRDELPVDSGHKGN
jgi:thiosulfate/3-mercaptopyruvate sulfurtransferase